MQTETGCKINVSPASGQDFEREIGLIGTRDSIERAKHAIMEKVHAVVSVAIPHPAYSCLTMLQQEKNRGNQRRGDDQQYSNPNFSEVNTQPYGQQQQRAQQQQPSGADKDPYAAYGGYENYVALWYSSYQQNAQQNPQTRDPQG